MKSNTGNNISFATKVITVTIILVLSIVFLFLSWHLAQMLLIVFAGVLLAVFLDGLSGWLRKYLHLPRAVSLPLILILLLGFFVFSGLIMGPQIAGQFVKLTDKIPTALNSVKESLSESSWGKTFSIESLTTRDLWPVGSDIIGRITGVFSTALGFIGSVLLILFIGIYLAATPDQYVNGVVRLFPHERRQRIHEVLVAVGTALRWWLVGRITAMAVIGIFVAGGLWITGVPLALSLGLIAALLSFVPFIGPLLAAIPIILVALAEDPILVIWALVVYQVAQLVESYVLTPLIQRRAVFMPPALLITVQILMSVLFGIPGMLMATPLTLTVILLVQMLYIQDMLGDQVRLMGDHSRRT